MSVGVPEGPRESSSVEAFVQGLQYIRNNPSDRVDERVQRFLWLDQWIAILDRRGRLNDRLAQEFWADLTSFVTDPSLSRFGLQKILERVETTLGRNVALYQMYGNSLREGSANQALQHLNFIQDDGISDLYRRASQLLELRLEQEVSEFRKIGVLIPLSGDLKAFGQEVLNSIQLVSDMAFAEGIEFVVEDIGESDEQMLEAFQSLVLDENVTAVIGPMTARRSEYVFERAQIMRVPVVSLALTEDLEIFGDYNFRSALTVRDQVDAVARFARRNLGARNIAMLFPDSNYGWDVAKLAEAEFKRENLNLREVRIYQPGETDFKDPLQNMTRLDLPRLRSDELCPEGVAPAPGLCVARLDDLPPILSFEVLFVPETSPDTAGLLLPTLPFLNIRGVQVIGLSGFHSPQLITRAGNSAENVIFTDGFYPHSEDLGTREFVSRYKALAEAEPSAMAAEAFDVALMMVELFRSFEGPLSRRAFRDRMANLRAYEGVTGRLYAEGQQIRKTPRFFVVRDAEFKLLR